ncbi:MAG: TonB family protein [Acidobacteria bacterium]|nr:TonB family protein [Acidobacteriota bacterium]
MHDRVGEILAARAAQSSGAAPAVALSVVLHGALTAAAIYAAMHAPAPQTANILSIRFAPTPRASAPAAPVSKPPTPVARPAAPVPVIPKIVEPAPQVTASSLVKPEPKTVPLSTFGRSTRKGSEHPAPAPPTPAAATPAATTGIGIAEVPVGGAGVTGLEGGDFPYTIYIENMKRLVGTKWFRPQTGNGSITTVYFVIERDGSIRDAKVETPSGNGTFDRAALRAILEASPLPPLPFAYNGTYLGVHLTFK